MPWQPSTTATPPVELRRRIAGRLATVAIVTVFLIALLAVVALWAGALGSILLSVGVLACALGAVVWILYTAAVESLTLRERVLLQRRWWGAEQRTPVEDVATVVYLPKYGMSSKDGWEYRPFLVLLDANGRRLHKLRCATWSEERLEALAGALPTATKLKVTGRIDAMGLRRFDRQYPGVRRRATVTNSSGS